MRVGIVGSEQAKFTPETEEKARQAIRDIIGRNDFVISGACHLGGVDLYAVEEARKLGVPESQIIEHRPHVLAWPGYEARNIKIAQDSDLLVCITLKELPASYTGMRFKICYHCKTDKHVKSGGCWTMKVAKQMGKLTRLIVIE